jgi:hypothetical protein
MDAMLHAGQSKSEASDTLLRAAVERYTSRRPLLAHNAIISTFALLYSMRDLFCCIAISLYSASEAQQSLRTAVSIAEWSYTGHACAVIGRAPFPNRYPSLARPASALERAAFEGAACSSALTRAASLPQGRASHLRQECTL